MTRTTIPRRGRPSLPCTGSGGASSSDAHLSIDQDRSEPSYEVGYQKTPAHSRFKKGRSGNPNGRPKKSRNLLTIVKQVFDEQISVREGGRPKKMSAIEAVLRTWRQRALQGDVKILSALVGMFAKIGYGVGDDQGAADLLPAGAQSDIIDDYVSRYLAERRNASGPASESGAPSTKTPKSMKG